MKIVQLSTSFEFSMFECRLRKAHWRTRARYRRKRRRMIGVWEIIPETDTFVYKVCKALEDARKRLMEDVNRQFYGV